MEFKPKNDELICGIDLNLDHAAGVISDYQGQFRGHNTFHYPNLGEMVKDKTKWYIGNLATQIIGWCKENSITSIVLENLSINQKYNNNQNFNRHTMPFANRQLNTAIQRTALRNGINICLVAPNYTSFIGQIKYARMYGISRHLAAAYLIARRGLKLDEKLPKPIIQKLPEIAEGAGKNADRLKNWKENSSKNGHPWLLWATLYDISKSKVRNRATYGRNYLFWLLCSGDNISPVLCLTAGQDPPTWIAFETTYTRPSGKADGRTNVI